MGAPNDNGSGQTATGDFKLTLPEIGAPPSGPSDRFKLKINWETPHLEWRPVKGADIAKEGAGAPPPPPPPPDPEKAIEKAERYFKSGLLFNLRRPNWDLVDKAFLSMPLATPLLKLGPDDITGWQDNVFFGGLGRTPGFIGAPGPVSLMSPSLFALPPPSLFYKLPDPSQMMREPGPPRQGQIGDALKAVWGLPFTQRLVGVVNDEAQRQLHRLGNDFDNLSFWYQAAAVTFAVSMAGGVAGGVLGSTEARHDAFRTLRGVELPIPYTPGFTFTWQGYGAASPFLTGQPAPLSFMFKFDLPETIRVIDKFFHRPR
jgi:hypothetical protein